MTPQLKVCLICGITLPFKGSIHPDSLKRCCGMFTTWSVKLFWLCYDHKPWPDHPRDPAGYCQTCNGTAVIVGSPTSFIQNRTWLSFVVAGNRYCALQAPWETRELQSRSWCWWCGIWFSIKDGWGHSVRQGGHSVSHLSSRLCVCIHLFCFSALCPVWAHVQSQASVRPKPGNSCSWPICFQWVGDAGALLVWITAGMFASFKFLANFPSACIPQITKLCSRTNLVDRDDQTTSLHLIRGLFIHTVTLAD